jgi:large subunit ribosomal protein L23
MLSLIPRVSEKAYAQSQNGTYVFNVPMTANKATVIAALLEQYQVKATDVRFIVQKGKPVRASRGKRAQPGTALRSKTKKAYVSLVEGAHLNLFNEEDSSTDKKAEK